MGGSIVALLIARAVFQQVQDPAQQYLTIGIICAIISVVPIFYCVWGTQARAKLVNQYQSARIENPQSQPLKDQLRSVFTNWAFMLTGGQEAQKIDLTRLIALCPLI